MSPRKKVTLASILLALAAIGVVYADAVTAPELEGVAVTTDDAGLSDDQDADPLGPDASAADDASPADATSVVMPVDLDYCVGGCPPTPPIDPVSCPFYCSFEEIESGTCEHWSIQVEYASGSSMSQPLLSQLHVRDEDGTLVLHPPEPPLMTPTDFAESPYFYMPREVYYEMFGSYHGELRVGEGDTSDWPDESGFPTAGDDDLCADELETVVFPEDDPGAPLVLTSCDCRDLAEYIGKEYARNTGLPGPATAAPLTWMAMGFTAAPRAPTPPPAPRPAGRPIRLVGGKTIDPPNLPASHPVHTSWSAAVALQRRLDSGRTHGRWEGKKASRNRGVIGISQLSAVYADMHPETVALALGNYWLELAPHWSFVQGVDALNVAPHLKYRKRDDARPVDLASIAGGGDVKGIDMGLMVSPVFQGLRELYRAKIKRIGITGDNLPFVEFDIVDLKGDTVVGGLQMQFKKELMVAAGQGLTPLAAKRSTYRKKGGGDLDAAAIAAIDAANTTVEVLWGGADDTARAALDGKTVLVIGTGGVGLQFLKETTDLADGKGTIPTAKIHAVLALGDGWKARLENDPAAQVNPFNLEEGNLVPIKKKIEAHLAAAGTFTKDEVHLGTDPDRTRIHVKEIEYDADAPSKKLKVKLQYYKELDDKGEPKDPIDGPVVRVDYIAGAMGGSFNEDVRINKKIIKDLEIHYENAEIVGLISRKYNVKFTGLTSIQVLTMAESVLTAVEFARFTRDVATPFRRGVREQNDALFTHFQDWKNIGVLPGWLQRTRKSVRGATDGRGTHEGLRRFITENNDGDWRETRIRYVDGDGKTTEIERIRMKRKVDADHEVAYSTYTGNEENPDAAKFTPVANKGKACRGCHTVAKRKVTDKDEQWVDVIFKFNPRPYGAPGDYDGPLRDAPGIAAMVQYYQSLSLTHQGKDADDNAVEGIWARPFRLGLRPPSAVDPAPAPAPMD